MCVSKRNKPYTEAQCALTAQGCVWLEGQCRCKVGVYSKRSRACGPSKSSEQMKDAGPSQCVSNRGLPYSQEDCRYTTDCVWRDGSCVCRNRGTYAKSSKYCWPPVTEVTTSTVATTTSAMAPYQGNTSECVSNRGNPYNQWQCTDIGIKYGCIWKDDHCVCKNGGYFAKSSLLAAKQGGLATDLGFLGVAVSMESQVNPGPPSLATKADLSQALHHLKRRPAVGPRQEVLAARYANAASTARTLTVPELFQVDVARDRGRVGHRGRLDGLLADPSQALDP